jgi:hypothetical protein
MANGWVRTDLMSRGESQDLNTEQHQQRADEMGDAMRRYLIGINTGGVGVVVALASEDGGPSPWLVGVACSLPVFRSWNHYDRWQPCPSKTQGTQTA